MSFTQVFTNRFEGFFHNQPIHNITFCMNDFKWNVPLQNGQFQPIGMKVPENTLRIEESDVVFIAVEDPSNIRLLVLGSNGSEKMYY
ncbi:hypothetical protein RHGRI_028854 [Rhododendron griersonianum]|uniref:Uncharacterized protein n=1 Tax=Rhododendron griersonianum TaxID=479676 RepID=A0AAV6IHA3_9ERIC|nr:hypothetical protein RHGRI_028854 [Rhododendron griersonianum]